MNEVGATNNPLQEYMAPKKEDVQGSEELGQKAFLKLMITQLENQDPLSPQENGEFIAQLAQFSSVESLDQLNNQFDDFSQSFVANQALQASTLVGRSVSVPATSTYLEEGGWVSISSDIPASTNDVKLNIYNETGALVEQVSAGAAESGEHIIRWNGDKLQVNGSPINWNSAHEQGLPPGKYSFELAASIDGKMTQMETHLSANVNSVTMGKTGGLILNLAGVGSVSMSDVKQFNE